MFFAFFPEKIDCPIEIYFTIDTSESIALQESPPGSLVNSIKVGLVYVRFYYLNLNQLLSHNF